MSMKKENKTRLVVALKDCLFYSSCQLDKAQHIVCTKRK